MKILALKWRRLGDTVLWTSALEALRQLYPSAEIDIAFDEPYAPLFESDSRFQNRYLLSNDPNRQNVIANQWRARGYDWALVFHANSKSRRLARRARAKRNLFHHHDRRGLRFGSSLEIVDVGKAMPATERDLNVVRTLGYQGPTPETRIFTKRAINATPLILLSPGASRPAKRWPMEHYLALAKALTGNRVAVIAQSAEDFESVRPIFDRLNAVAPVHFTPTLKQAIELVGQARLFVGGDSGLKHLAIALGVRTLTLFGPESMGEWHPYDPKTHPALQKFVRCRTQDAQDPRYAWCGVEVCPLASHACLTQIAPEEVAATIGSYLSSAI